MWTQSKEVGRLPDTDLRISKDTFRDLFDNIGRALSAGMSVLSPSLKLIRINEQARETLGIEPGFFKPGDSYRKLLEYLAGRGDLGHGAVQNIVKERLNGLRTFQAQGEGHSDTWDMRMKTGRHIRYSRSVIKGGFILITIVDRTHEVVSDQLFKVGLTLGKATCWRHDLTNGTISVEGIAALRLSYREQDLVAKKGLFALVYPDDLAALRKNWARASENGDMLDERFRIYTDHKGVRWVRCIIRFEYADDHTVLAAVAHMSDITDDMQDKARLRDLRAKSEAAHKVEQRFLARMNHEFRTPLNGIKGITEALMEDDLPADLKANLKTVAAAVGTLESLVDDALNLSDIVENRIELNIQSVNISRLVRTATNSWRTKAANKGLRIENSIAADTPDLLRADKLRLQHSLDNILSNAIKFTDSGTIKLDVSRRAKAEGQPQALSITVSDTGPGMSPRQLKAALRDFSQADESVTREHDGAGLGLPVAYKLIKLMGGDMEISSDIGVGTRVTLTLPIKTMIERQAQNGDPSPEDISQIRVLVVDDAKVNRQAVQLMLGKKVKNLVLAQGGPEALEYLETQDFDAVLMDIHMPGMDGIEATRKIRTSGKDWANIPVIALTADPEFRFENTAQVHGMDGSIGKPASIKDLVSGLSSLSTRSGPSPRVSKTG